MSSRRAGAFVVLVDIASQAPWGGTSTPHQSAVDEGACFTTSSGIEHVTTVLEFTNPIGGKYDLNVLLTYISIFMSECASFIWVLEPFVFVDCCTFFSLGFLGAFYMLEK